jgi:Uma2 family endonuclease
MATQQKALSLDDFLRLPEQKPALEYIDGAIRQKVSPKLRHGFLQYQLAARINAVALPDQIAVAAPEVRSTFANESRVPDVAVFRWNRVPLDSDCELADDVFIPPDIAIEVDSPQQSVSELHRRCRWYATNGVEIALIVDPAKRSVLVFRADGSTDEWRGPDRIDLAPVVPGFELTVEQLFASLRLAGRSGA